LCKSPGGPWSHSFHPSLDQQGEKALLALRGVTTALEISAPGEGHCTCRGQAGASLWWNVVWAGYMGKEKGLGPNEKCLYSESGEL